MFKPLPRCASSSSEVQVRVFPSTGNQETWLPYPVGCAAANPPDPGHCGYLRGTLPVNSLNSSGFANNHSTSWLYNGIFTLTPHEDIQGYGVNGLYGFDTVALNGSEVNMTHQAIAIIADLEPYWSGLFGLGPKNENFTTYLDPVPSYMRNLAANKAIPSLSE